MAKRMKTGAENHAKRIEEVGTLLKRRNPELDPYHSEGAEKRYCDAWMLEFDFCDHCMNGELASHTECGLPNSTVFFFRLPRTHKYDVRF
jgi:hypothetical protein